MIATSAMRCYIRAFNFRLERYICITMENFTFNSEGAPGSDETEESISLPGDVSRDSLEISLRHLRLRRMQQVFSLWGAEEAPIPNESTVIAESTTEGAPGSDETEESISSPGDVSRDSLEISLRHLRLRRMQQVFSLWGAEEAPIPNESTVIAESTTEGAGDEDASGAGAGDEAGATVDFNFSAALDELSQEIRRMGREMFKTNRAAERNQEIFTEALTEIRSLASTVAKIPQQNEATLTDAKFEAKAFICRELLRMADSMEASLSAVDELIAQLKAKAGAPAQGAAYWFAATRQLRVSLAEAVSSLRQWREGQSLQADRLLAILRTAGVREIETEGRAFDPALHRAISIAHRNDVAPGTIVGEELKGYTLDGRILRYAEVIVAKNEQDSRN